MNKYFLIIILILFSFSCNPENRTPILPPEQGHGYLADETTTGYIGAGYTLNDLTPSGSLNITTDGTTIDRLNITGNIIIDADNVTIKNCRITCSTAWPIIKYSGVNTLIEYTEIIGTINAESAIGGNYYTARHLNIHSVGDGLKSGAGVTIEYCYIHDLALGPGAHADGIQHDGGDNAIIRYNRIIVPMPDSTSCILVESDSETINNVLIDNNILDGGQYTVYSRNGGNGNPTNVTISNNRFGRTYHYGLFSTDGVVTFSNNTWLDTNEAVPTP